MLELVHVGASIWKGMCARREFEKLNVSERYVRGEGVGVVRDEDGPQLRNLASWRLHVSTEQVPVDKRKLTSNADILALVVSL